MRQSQSTSGGCGVRACLILLATLAVGLASAGETAPARNPTLAVIDVLERIKSYIGEGDLARIERLEELLGVKLEQESSRPDISAFRTNAKTTSNMVSVSVRIWKTEGDPPTRTTISITFDQSALCITVPLVRTVFRAETDTYEVRRHFATKEGEMRFRERIRHDIDHMTYLIQGQWPVRLTLLFAYAECLASMRIDELLDKPRGAR